MLKKLLITFLILLTSSYALTKEQIKPEMSNKIDKVLMVLKDSKLPKDKKNLEIESILSPVFDYKIMAMLSLGRTWKTLNKNQRDEFVNLFTKQLKNSYSKQLDLYTDELVEIIGLEEPKSSRAVLKTQLVGKDKRFDINYKFYKKKKSNDWLIYDVDLLGVSIVKTYQAQYKGFLKDKTYEQLVTHLKNNNK